MHYTSQHRFAGDTDKAFAAIETMLMPNGFRITDRGPRSISLQGRGMQSTKESPLRGATRIHIEQKGGHLRLDAFLGGVRFMMLFVCVFPVLLFLGMTLLPPLIAGHGWQAIDFKPLLGGVAWLIIGPAMSVWIRKRTTNALEDMLNNAAVVGDRS